MLNLFIDYPPVSWNPGWAFSSGPEDLCQLMTGTAVGTVTLPGAAWTLHFFPESTGIATRLFSNGLSVATNRKTRTKRVDGLLVDPGVFTGRFHNLPAPTLSSPFPVTTEPDSTWIELDGEIALLRLRGQRFALVSGPFSKGQALRKAEDALDESFEELEEAETKRRQPVAGLFSINPRHNPPVALAAESLFRRLKERTPFIHGIWSAADGFDTATFSLNELYALVQAWILIDPSTALQLVHTALSLQQNSGGFPAWINLDGVAATSSPWPLLIQSFEQAWNASGRNPLVLKQSLPALRKYIQWALRYFDPHRDGIPSWQNNQEVFVPDSFERDKATPELTAMLLEETDALLRLCEKNHDSAAAGQSLSELRDQLIHTLDTIFWNPEKKSFPHVWKNGHFIEEPSVGSFLPLLWRNLPNTKKNPLLDNFEETHGFPGGKENAAWETEEVSDSATLPAIHQFLAFEALRRADQKRALLLIFVRRARGGFAAWFERECIEAARPGKNTAAAFEIGPVTASLILVTQCEFQHEAVKNAPALTLLQRMIHHLHLRPSDFRILMITLIAILIVHLAYNLPHHDDANARMAEAAINYHQGRLNDALAICRRYPEHALSCFLQANLRMITENPEPAVELYHQALRKETASPSALLGYALALQMTGNYEHAIRRYNDFIDLYEDQFSNKNQNEVIELAYQFLHLAEEKFSNPPAWKRLYSCPLMNDLGL